MAQVDTSIYGNLLRPAKSVQEYDAERMQGQLAQRQNKLAEMMLGDKLRASEQAQAKTGAYRGAFDPATGKMDNGKLRGALGGLGDYEGLQALDTADTARATAARAEERQRLADGKAKFELIGQVIGSAKDQNSYSQGVQALHRMGIDMGDVPPQFDPAYVQQAQAQVMTAAQQIEQVWKQKGYDLDVSKFGETVRNNKEQTATTIRGQNMTAGTAAAGRAQSAAQHRDTLAQGGKPPAGYRFTADGNMQAIPGGPADLKINAAGVQKNSEAKDVLSLLDEVDALLPKATGSYLGAGVDALAGGVGYGTKGAESTAQLKALEGALISKMPKMSGPQSDKDVLLYKQMAGQVGDNTIPVNQRQAASGMIRKLNEKYAGMAEGSSKKGLAYDDAAKEARYNAWKAKQ